MSRVSLSRRLQAVLEAVENIDPQAARVHRMKSATRLRFDVWQAECARVMAEHGDSADAFAAYLVGKLETPDPPKDVAEALRLRPLPMLREGMSVHECAEIYEQFKEGK
jgi:hypothetical protein